MKKCTCIVLLLFSICFTIYAHPHMFADCSVAVNLEMNILKSLEVTWKFDPMFTAAIQADFDLDGDGEISSKESKTIYRYAFSNLAMYDYFIYVQTGSAEYVPSEIKNFNAWMEYGSLIYNFQVPFQVRIEDVLTIAVIDKSYYCDVQFVQDNPVVLKGNPAAAWEILTNTEMAIRYGGDVSVARQGKEYTGVAYPMQIVVKVP